MRYPLNDADLDLLEDAVRTIVQKAGMKVCNEEILLRLKARGAAVDMGEQIARFPERMIDEVLDMQKATQVDRPGEPERLPHGTEHKPAMGYDITPRIYDFRERRPRQATRVDLLDMIDLGDALEDVGSIGCPVVMGDVDARIEAIQAFAELVSRTNKQPNVVSILPEHNKYFAEIGEIVLGPSEEPRFIGRGGFLITPLTINDRLAGLMLEGEKYGVKSAGVATMPISGMSAPATIAGTVALAAAEVVGGWIVLHAANPHVTRFTGGSASGILDMRTTKGLFGMAEAAMQDVCFVNLLEERFGGGGGVSGPGYIDSTTPGLQSVYEKLLKSHIINSCLGSPVRVNSPGLLDAGSLFSPTQYVLEIELSEGLVRSDWDVPVDAEHVPLDDILSVGAGESGNFLPTDHTLGHCRDSWQPELLDKTARALADGVDEETLLVDAEALWRDTLAGHEPPEVDEDRTKAVWEVVARARAELMG